MSESADAFGKKMSKVDKYRWKVVDEEGEFERIPKGKLNIDPAYQRDKVSNARVLEIARDWSWVSLNTLSVARRLDGSNWVMDGQHRKLAADKRSDINELPCMVYRVNDVGKEAAGFIAVNTVRGPVSMYHRFKASVVSGDPAALAVKAMIESTNYSVALAGTAKHTIACIGAVMKCYELDADAMRRVWPLACSVADGEVIKNEVMLGLFYVERFLARNSLGSLWDGDKVKKLRAAKLSGIVAAINKAKGYFGARETTYAQGIVNVLNRGRSSGRIPNIAEGPEG